jgi:DNA-binding transcriptional ArsR family regulator
MVRTGADAASPPDLGSIDLVTVLQALSDPVRLDIVRQLARCPERGELSCGQLDLTVGKSTVSHHVRTLHQAGVISQRDEGTRRYTCLRRDELEARFPGLLDSVIRASVATA